MTVLVRVRHGQWQQLEMPDVRTYEVNAAGSGHEAPR